MRIGNTSSVTKYEVLKILLIEDEPKLNSFLKKGLKEQGFVVDAVNNGSEGMEFASANDYDIILLDLMLPGQNGFDVLQNMRAFKIATPVIIISALNDTENVVKGLDMGATDYLKKPFDFNELVARLKVATRKSVGESFSNLKIDDVRLDLLQRKVWRNEVEIHLTTREFNLLHLLVANCNRIITKTEIAEKIWEVNFDMSSNVIEVHMFQLRKKLGEGLGNKLVQTKVGVGYYVEGELIRS